MVITRTAASPSDVLRRRRGSGGGEPLAEGKAIMRRVLFICVHNSARSVMAEAYLKHFGGDAYEVESAGFEPQPVNPLVREALAEEGLDVSDKEPQRVFDAFKEGKIFNYVISVCSESLEDMCPIFPGMTHRLHLPFMDPQVIEGSDGDKMVKVRELRDQVKKVIREFIAWEQSGGKRQLGQRWEVEDIAQVQSSEVARSDEAGAASAARQ